MRFSVAASSGCRSVSPSRYIAPSFKKIRREVENRCKSLRSSANSLASFGLIGKPCSASRIAGASTSANFIVPYVFSAASSPATVPGTATDL